LTAFNAADPGRLEKVFQQLPEPRPVERALDLRRRTGGFDLRKVVESTPTQLRAWLQERAGDQVAEARVEVDAKPPHRVQRLDVRPIPTPTELAPARLPEGEALRRIRERIDKLAAEEHFSGSVLIAHQGKPVLREARGMQDRVKEIPNRLDTRFNLGSMNKMFTAVAVLQLAQQGKLKLDDPVGKYLLDYPNPEVAKKVTIHNLLSHTGGMGDIFGPEFEANLEKLKAPADYIALYGKRPLEFEPGSQWAYSNYGMVVAGAIVERVSGMSYFDYVKRNVFQPAGMKDSDSYWKTTSTPNLAKGYTSGPGHPTEENYRWLPMRGSPAGGGYSTVEDLLRFATALTSHRLLDDEHTALLTTAKPGTPSDHGYGYGFAVSHEGGVRSFGHGGGAPGINSDLKIFPELRDRRDGQPRSPRRLPGRQFRRSAPAGEAASKETARPEALL
jgi:CubicO group peptidase (beta-lactamase class C family)